ncbi:hypothetical protein AB0N09_33285 [Streptomyces erythrochromogenes]|uniref:hypothetical protein n=1 Tax=Streptomyces erythrochromogenes TaxID=285574 RepID=UPI0034407698
MEAGHCSIEEFRLRITAAQQRLDHMRDEARQYADEQVNLADEGPLRSLLEGDTIANAYAQYLHCVEEAADRFLTASEEILLLQEEISSEIDRFWGPVEDPGEPGAGHLVFEAADSNELLWNVQNAAGRFAFRVREIQLRFHAAWTTFTTECAERRVAFRKVISQQYGIAVDVLDGACVLGAFIAATGAGLAATALYAGGCLGVMGVVGQMSAVWAYGLTYCTLSALGYIPEG